MLDVCTLIREKYKLECDERSPILIPDKREGGLTSLWGELGYVRGAEIGVERGLFSEQICKDNPAVHLYSIDPWKEYFRYAERIPQYRLDQYYATAVERLHPYHVDILRLTSMEAVKLFKPESLDFVYIDGDHELSHVIEDICAWEKIVRKGGIVSGHDYTPERENHRLPLHVQIAVDAYTSAYRIQPLYLWTKDDGPSWMWVK